MGKNAICGIISYSGFNSEPLACAYAPDHDGPHSWASLPTFPWSETTEPTTDANAERIGQMLAALVRRVEGESGAWDIMTFELEQVGYRLESV